jgi:putative membrane protein
LPYRGGILTYVKNFLLATGCSLIGLSAVFHFYVFYLESLSWTKPRTWKTFGVPNQEAAEIIRPMAFNQGFYNLFLAMEITVGLVALSFNKRIGFTLIVAGAVSILGAGIVLFLSVKSSRRAAFIQAGPPLIGLIFLLLGALQ